MSTLGPQTLQTGFPACCLLLLRCLSEQLNRIQLTEPALFGWCTWLPSPGQIGRFLATHVVPAFRSCPALADPHQDPRDPDCAAAPLLPLLGEALRHRDGDGELAGALIEDGWVPWLLEWLDTLGLLLRPFDPEDVVVIQTKRAVWEVLLQLAAEAAGDASLAAPDLVTAADALLPGREWLLLCIAGKVPGATRSLCQTCLAVSAVAAVSAGLPAAGRRCLDGRCQQQQSLLGAFGVQQVAVVINTWALAPEELWGSLELGLVGWFGALEEPDQRAVSLRCLVAAASSLPGDLRPAGAIGALLAVLQTWGAAAVRLGFPPGSLAANWLLHCAHQDTASERSAAGLLVAAWAEIWIEQGGQQVDAGVLAAAMGGPGGGACSGCQDALTRAWAQLLMDEAERNPLPSMRLLGLAAATCPEVARRVLDAGLEDRVCRLVLELSNARLKDVSALSPAALEALAACRLVMTAAAAPGQADVSGLVAPLLSSCCRLFQTAASWAHHANFAEAYAKAKAEGQGVAAVSSETTAIGSGAAGLMGNAREVFASACKLAASCIAVLGAGVDAGSLPLLEAALDCHRRCPFSAPLLQLLGVHVAVTGTLPGLQPEQVLAEALVAVEDPTARCHALQLLALLLDAPHTETAGSQGPVTAAKGIVPTAEQSLQLLSLLQSLALHPTDHRLAGAARLVAALLLEGMPQGEPRRALLRLPWTGFLLHASGSRD